MRLHAHESDRLESLHSYEILDTSPEDAYDGIAGLAATLCHAPIALISFIDRDRQWFKSAIGISLRETPRSAAICSDVVARCSPLLISDATAEPDYADNPFVVADNGIRSYAGVPLVGRDGLPLGTLCVMDRRLRSFTVGQLEGLVMLAVQVVAQLELRRADRAVNRVLSPIFDETNDPGRLRRAYDAGQFRPHFQPIVDLRTGGTTGFEALLRWVHPEHGVLRPASFLPAIESTGLMLPLGRQVLNMSLDARARLNQLDPGRPLSLAVNVSCMQLRQPGLARAVLLSLARYATDPALLTLEITETLSIQDSAAARAELGVLHRAGVKIALDDYGTGFSALGRILDLPISTLKVDRSLVSGLGEDLRHVQMVESTLALSATLGLDVVCEGVETQEQRRLLLDLGAVTAQGYLFGKPMAERDAACHLRRAQAVGPAIPHQAAAPRLEAVPGG